LAKDCPVEKKKKNRESECKYAANETSEEEVPLVDVDDHTQNKRREINTNKTNQNIVQNKQMCSAERSTQRQQATQSSPLCESDEKK